MAPKGITYPQQLAVLTKVLQDYCATRNIEAGTEAYEDASRRVMDLHELGITDAIELAKGMLLAGDLPAGTVG